MLVAADALGAAQWMLDTTVEYVKERKQFGVAVGSFQAVKHYAAQMIVPIEATRAAVSYAAWALDEGEDDAVLHAWIAKAYAADHLNDVADKALFLHGAIGYTWEHDLQLPFKRVKADAQIAGGAAGYHDRVARPRRADRRDGRRLVAPARARVGARALDLAPTPVRARPIGT